MIPMDCLREASPRHPISRRGDGNWPAHSPHLAPCDYFLWGYRKLQVYKDRPHTLKDLQNNISAEIANIPVNMREKVDQSF